jgi:hypothetical protein
MEAARTALKGDDASAINAARDELMQGFSAAGQEMYQTQADAAAAAQEASDSEPPQDAEAGAEEEEVVEADYEIVEDQK